MTENNYSRKIAVGAGQFRKERSYWEQKLGGELEKCYFPYDIRAGTQIEPAAETIAFKIDGDLLLKLMRLCNNFEPRLHIVLVTTVTAVLFRYTGSSDIIVGSPIYKQEQEGSFTNTVLALRNRLDDTVSFKQLLLATKQLMVEAVENQAYPLELLPDKLDIVSPKEDGGFPLFDTAVVLQNIQDVKYIRHIHVNTIFSFLKTAHCLEGQVEYNSAVYERSTIERISGSLRQFLLSALKSVDSPVSMLDILTDEEKHSLLVEFNNTRADIRYTGTIHQLFETQVEKTPDHIAVSETGASNSLSYRQLNSQSSQLARRLKHSGVTTESVVGLMLEPGIDMAVALLGILKAGGAYLPIDTGLPQERVRYMLEDAGAGILLSAAKDIADFSYTALQGFEWSPGSQVKVTPTRSHIAEFDRLPRPNRRLINLKNYKNKIGMASVTNCVSFQATRGCPFHCLFCHKIWSKHHVYRSAENVFSEIQHFYNNGVTNFAFIDDCFNLNIEKSSRVFEAIIKNKLEVQLFFPNGLRGDIMTPDYIDLMVEAGTRGINLSLESASPRFQKLLKKYLDLDKFKEVIDYIASRHPKVVLELASMHGFPTETEEEAMMTLDFIKSIKWLHFPYLHILKIFPNTGMEEFALKNGVSKKDILASRSRAFHELPETLPFPKSFTRKYQADFLNNYFLNKQRLMHVLPHQMKVLNESALLQKYNAYLPVEIKKIEDLIDFAQLDGFQVPHLFSVAEKSGAGPEGTTIFDLGPQYPPCRPDAKRIMLIDLSQHFSSHKMLYRVVEQPLGLISLLTYLKERFDETIDGRVYKSGNDFDSFEELKVLVDEFKPDLIGLRTLTFFREFFHETAAQLRQWGVTAPIITGGPYASSDYNTILKDSNFDLVVLGEGEYTLAQLVEEMFAIDFKLPAPNVLANIRGIAYRENRAAAKPSRQILLLDRFNPVEDENEGTGVITEPLAQDHHLAYVMYTSGSTGKSKGVMVEHRQVNNCISWMQDTFPLDEKAVIANRTNLSFDPSVWEIFWPLYIGGGVKILDKYQRKDAQFLIELMAGDRQLTMMYCPSTMVSMVTYLLKSRDNPPRLKLPWLIIGAEPISPQTVRQFYRYFDGKMVNTYGPTECTINNTWCHLHRDQPEEPVPIGKPVVNNQLYIVDSHMQPMPMKVPGEICIGGQSVARGYVNNLEKTGLAFIDNPFGEGLLYKTGDIGRWLQNGNIEILGRMDEQVKIRGYRIELGEIENALSSHPSIDRCVVAVKDAAEGKKKKKKVETCRMCGIATQYPQVTLNDDGVCNICDNYTGFKPIIANYFKKPDQLRQAILSARRDSSAPYDCLLLYAGGRGAAYALYQLVEMGLKVLTAAYDNGYFSKRDLKDIKKITDSLGVEHVTLTHKNSDKILGESINVADTVCRGCFHTSSSLAGEYAYSHDIPVVVGATLSRGQIIENKLLMFLSQGITGVKELEEEIKKVQRSAPEIDRSIFEHIDIPVIQNGQVHEKVSFFDFYRFFDITNRDMIDYLNNKDPHWKTRKDYAVYSTNCPIKQVGDFGHLQAKGFHYYGGATSWEKRLGHLTLENIKEDLQCKITKKGYDHFTARIGFKEKNNGRGEVEEKYLCAYLVANDGNGREQGDALEDHLKEHLKERIPSYMIPGYFMWLEELPLTSNGKVDKKTLPEPQRSRSRSKGIYKAPETQLEMIIASAWQEILKLDKVGIDDNFFDLGGNSLDIVMMGTRLKETTKKEIPAVTLFTYPTISTLAAHLTQKEPANTGTAVSPSPMISNRSDQLKKGQNRLKHKLQRSRGWIQ